MVNSLGDKVKKLRKNKGLTLEKLGELTGSSKGYIWELENRNNKKPSGEKIAKLAHALDVTTDFLLDDTLSELDDNMEVGILFRKIGRLKEDEREKIKSIIEAWSQD